MRTPRQLAERGVRILLTARTSADGREAAGRLARGGGDVRFEQLDVADPACVEAARRRLADSHFPVDILVNNAGLYTTTPHDEPSGGTSINGRRDRIYLTRELIGNAVGYVQRERRNSNTGLSCSPWMVSRLPEPRRRNRGHDPPAAADLS